jgi:hypothetical protein
LPACNIPYWQASYAEGSAAAIFFCSNQGRLLAELTISPQAAKINKYPQFALTTKEDFVG